MYKGTAYPPSVMKNPPASQVPVVPIAHGLCGVPFGGIKGPRIRAPDWNMSAVERPMIKRL